MQKLYTEEFLKKLAALIQKTIKYNMIIQIDIDGEIIMMPEKTPDQIAADNGVDEIVEDDLHKSVDDFQKLIGGEKTGEFSDPRADRERAMKAQVPIERVEIPAEMPKAEKPVERKPREQQRIVAPEQQRA